MHHVRQLQCGQRIDLAEAEGLAGKEGLEEDGAEALVGKRLAVDRASAEAVFPDIFPATPDTP